MATDFLVSEQTHRYFLQEATDLLRVINGDLQTLREDFSLHKVHSLMRAAHTLKGASASAGFDGVTKISHSLEDIFRALCHEDTIITTEIERLLFEGYECLQLLLSSRLEGAKVDGADLLDRMATVVTALQGLLGDRFGQEGYLPTSSELGFDLTQSIFEVGVTQRIEALAAALEDLDAPDVGGITHLLLVQMEVFMGLAESLALPGLGAIAKTTLIAVDQHPEHVVRIALAVLDDLSRARAAVLAGDRQQGGSPSNALQQFCDPNYAGLDTAASPDSEQILGASGADGSAGGRRDREVGWLKRRWRSLTHRPLDAPDIQSPSDQQTADQQTAAPSISESVISEFLAEPSDALEDTKDNSTGVAIDVADADITELADLAPVELNNLSIQPRRKASASTATESSATESLASIVSSVDTDSAAFDASSSARKPAFDAKDAAKMPGKGESIRMSVEHLNQLNQSVGELLTQQNRQTLYHEQLSALVKKLLDRISQQQQQLNQHRENQYREDRLRLRRSPHQNLNKPDLSTDASRPNPAYDNFDILELEQYSDLQLLVQSCLEETVQQSESAEAIELFVRRSGQALEKQKQLLAGTRTTLLEARMVPLSSVFQRFVPAVARLRAQHRKKVDVTIKGGGVLVDRTVADKLYEPLIHLVRNAFDHGIETPDQRVAHGKSASGRIMLEGVQQGRYLTIKVSDNGRGLDLEMIRRRAIESQLITPVEAIGLTPKQTVDLLFEPGFSTLDEADDLSGRGIGLDAVQAQMRSLKGWVKVSYKPGTGTCFALQIPATLTIAKLLLCEAEGRVYALIADAVEHILMPQPQQMRVWESGKMLTWQTNDKEHLIPIGALCDVLHYASAVSNHRLRTPLSPLNPLKEPAKETQPVILLHHEAGLVGLEVDQIWGEQELVISPLGEVLAAPAYLYGSSTLPDGQLTLVLDSTLLAKMVAKQCTQGTVEAASTGARSLQKAVTDRPIFLKKLILTVDDSITVRNTLSEALQKANYQVIQARDGAEAVRQLQRYPDVQAILCDIEMPGMNGFEFLKVRQKLPKIAAIPTIMLTSRGGEKHRVLTTELGASAYLTKPYLSPQLIKTVTEVIENQACHQSDELTTELANELANAVNNPQLTSVVGGTYE